MDFEQIVNNLLLPENNSARLYETAKHYYSFLSEITEISDASENPADDDITFVKGGKAISPKDAARCILDYRRTAKFLQGIYAAIRHARKVFPGEKIEILYAGCGPFAALAVPQCAKFSSDEIAFTLIDIHQRSLDSAANDFSENSVLKIMFANLSKPTRLFIGAKTVKSFILSSPKRCRKHWKKSRRWRSL